MSTPLKKKNRHMGILTCMAVGEHTHIMSVNTISPQSVVHGLSFRVKAEAQNIELCRGALEPLPFRIGQGSRALLILNRLSRSWTHGSIFC